MLSCASTLAVQGIYFLNFFFFNGFLAPVLSFSERAGGRDYYTFSFIPFSPAPLRCRRVYFLNFFFFNSFFAPVPRLSRDKAINLYAAMWSKKLSALRIKQKKRDVLYQRSPELRRDLFSGSGSFAFFFLVRVLLQTEKIFQMRNLIIA